MAGTFYGVSVGPGDPELMTLKAVRIIEDCKIIAVPQTGNEKTLALSIASQAVDMSEKEIVSLNFLMTKDKNKLRESHEAIAEKLLPYLNDGIDVAMLNIGDVSIYSTFSYIREIIEEHGVNVEVCAGVPSFCAVAAELKVSLTTMAEPLHIIPAHTADIDEMLAYKGSKVIMKSGKSFPDIKKRIIEKKLVEKTHIVDSCGLPKQRIYENILEADESCSYFSTIVIEA